MGRQVESVYGNALFEAAKECGKLEQLLNEARAVRESVKQNPDVLKMLSHPNIEIEDKLVFVKNIFDDRTDDILTGLIIQAVKKGHGGKLNKILDEFVSLARNELKIGEAFVYSAKELTEAQKKSVHDRLVETTKYREMRIHYRVDETLIGGLVIKLGDRIVDSSIKTKLDLMTKSLM